MERGDDCGRGESHGMCGSKEREAAGKSQVSFGWLRDTYCPGNWRKRTKAGWGREAPNRIRSYGSFRVLPPPQLSTTSVLPVPASLRGFSPENWARCHKQPFENISIENVQVRSERGLLKTCKVCSRGSVFACSASEFENKSPGKHLHF